MKREKKSASRTGQAGKRGGKQKVTKVAKGKAKREKSESLAAMNPLSGKVWTLEVAREACVPSPTNPRKDFKEEGLVELGRNLRTVGQLQALVVRPRGEGLTQRLKSLRKRVEHGLTKEEKAELDVVEVLAGQQVLAETAPKFEEVAAVLSAPWMEFEIVAGERRWRAAGKKYADLKTVRVEVRLLSAEEVVAAQWVENLQREDLSPLEEAEGLARLREQGWTVEKLCERFGKSKTVVFEKLKLARAEGAVRELVASGAISPSVAALIASVPDKQMQERLVKTPKNSYGGCAAFDHQGHARTVVEVKEWIARECLKQIPWKLDLVFDHAEMVSPACRDCPKMTRNMGEENPDVVKGPPRCMGLTCFAERAKAATEINRAAAQAEGMEFWPYAEFREKAHQRDYCVEGDSNWEGNGKNEKWEKLAMGVLAKIVGEDRDGSLKLVWKRADLVAAGLVMDRKDTGAATSAKMKLDEKVFKGTKAKVLETLHERLNGVDPQSGLDAIEARIQAADKVVRAYFYAELLGYNAKETEKRTVDSVTIDEALGEMAKQLCGNRWYSLTEPPEGLALFGIDAAAIAETVRAELKEKTAAKGKKGLNAKSAKTAKVEEEEGELAEA